MREISKQIVGDNLKGELAPFSFMLPHIQKWPIHYAVILLFFHIEFQTCLIYSINRFDYYMHFS